MSGNSYQPEGSGGASDSPTQKRRIYFLSGEKFQVEFYFTEAGKIPAKEYLEEAALDIKVKLSALVKYIAEHGKIFDITKFRVVDSRKKIYEFKPLQYRFLIFSMKEEQ